WQTRPLEELYPIIYLDALIVKVRDGHQVRNKAAHLAVGVDLDGIKHVLGIWVQAVEGAKFWAGVCAELRNRGVRDVLIVCCDGLTGFPEAIEATWPAATVQTCTVHLIRAAMRFVSYQDRKRVAAALRPIYTAPTVEAAETELLAFADSELGRRYPATVATWENAWERFIPFLAFPPELRRIIYTTNSIESLNYQLRKIIKNRGHFPNDDAVIKLLWLAIRDIEDKRARDRAKERGKPRNQHTAPGRLVEGATVHGWKAEHYSWDEGRNDHFAEKNGAKTMGYYEASELPEYYALANQFAVSDRYFCSALAPTFPNRFFFLTGSAFGHTQNDMPSNLDQFAQPTIFDLLDTYGISWKYYTDAGGYLRLFGPVYWDDEDHQRPLAEYQQDLKAGTLPQVVFLESIEDTQDEHPPGDIRGGVRWVVERVAALRSSSAWKSSVLFLTYDENGGYFDHVPPPQACKPDEIAPKPGLDYPLGAYGRYGFRVPFIAISPWVKHHYVSHETADHTSILKFIETKFNLPALTRRDANANGLLDLFNFKQQRRRRRH
ncbi:MAG: IS256 family transposase, partial [Bdellovibrionota bacterium]